MTPNDVPEMKEYLEHLQRKDFEDLFRVEMTELEKCSERYSDLDWAELKGSELMHEYWLFAVSSSRQAELAFVSHLRANAWQEVWETFL